MGRRFQQPAIVSSPYLASTFTISQLISMPYSSRYSYEDLAYMISPAGRWSIFLRPQCRRLKLSPYSIMSCNVVNVSRLSTVVILPGAWVCLILKVCNSAKVKSSAHQSSWMAPANIRLRFRVLNYCRAFMSVILLRKGSCIARSTFSLVNIKSNYTRSAPANIAAEMLANVFSGNKLQNPLWAIFKGRSFPRTQSGIAGLLASYLVVIQEFIKKQLCLNVQKKFLISPQLLDLSLSSTIQSLFFVQFKNVAFNFVSSSLCKQICSTLFARDSSTFCVYKMNKPAVVFIANVFNSLFKKDFLNNYSYLLSICLPGDKSLVLKDDESEQNLQYEFRQSSARSDGEVYDRSGRAHQQRRLCTCIVWRTRPGSPVQVRESHGGCGSRITPFQRSDNSLQQQVFLKGPSRKTNIGWYLYVDGRIGALWRKNMFFAGLLGAVLIGIGQAIGESVMIGYLKRFDPGHILGWAIGTGAAGPIPALIYLIHRGIHTPFYLIYLTIVPFYLVYWLLFKQLEREPNFNSNEVKSLVRQSREDDSEEQEQNQNALMTFQSLASVLPRIYVYVLNLGAVYFLEYTILTCFADRASKDHTDTDPFYIKNAYAILSFSYQVGVLISRSSLSVMQVRRTYLLTIMQAILFGIWAAIPFFKVNRFVQFGLMLVVGLAGGCSYVNTYHILLKDKDLEDEKRELCTNCCILGNSTGTLSAQVCSIILSNTIYK